MTESLPRTRRVGEQRKPRSKEAEIIDRNLCYKALASALGNDGYWEYEHGPEASESAWVLGYHLNGIPYAEMPVAHFSGGGGGSAADGGGALTHVRELNSEGPWRVFPNPVRDRLYFDPATSPESSFRFQIYSAAGHLLHQGDTHPREGIDMTRLSPGAYLLVVESQGKSYCCATPKRSFLRPLSTRRQQGGDKS